ncbi:MAG: hypothetical protein RL088_1776 [Verrucomicrobiota bacterium]|jgi:hypothetical protein
MPFDPTIPADGAFATGAALRGQFNALKALIDAIPAGPPGPQGPVFASVQIGSVTTGAPGSAASASVNTFGNNVEISFTIPEGQPGSGVTIIDVNNAIANEIASTARNPSTVSDLSLLPSPTPTQSDLLAVIDKLNELLAALRR